MVVVVVVVLIGKSLEIGRSGGMGMFLFERD